MLLRVSKGILFNLQTKRLTWLFNSPRIVTKLPFLKNPKNLKTPAPWGYFYYPFGIWRLLWIILLPGLFFGLGLHGYYSLDLAKKQRFTKRNNYLQKLQIKKDSRFFYGFVLGWRLNFLSSTITLRNVFYNEIMEKTFPLFSTWNTLTGFLPETSLRHFLAPVLRKNSYKKWFSYIWKYPRAIGRVVLVN